MPFDGRSVVVERHAGHSSNQRGSGDMDHASMDHGSTDRTWTGEGSDASSSVDVSPHPVQLDNSISSDQPVADAEAPQSPSSSSSFNEAPLKRGQKIDLAKGQVDNGPTASTSKGGGEGGGPVQLPESLRHPRKSLPLIPRMTQYERHSLLQVRPGTGLSEFDLLVLEKDLFKKRCSVDDQHSSESVAEAGGASASAASSSSSSSTRRIEERRLIPRSAHYEPHPLLRKSVSGVCELELYLMEKDEEAARRQGAAVDRDDDADDDDGQTTSVAGGKRRGPWKLEPRLNQWEKHALLEVKDKSGLSELDRLFLDTEQQQERGKCAAECVCKSSSCKRCKKKQQQQTKLQSPTSSSVQQNMEIVAGWKGDSSKTSDDSSSATSAAPLLLSQKTLGQQQQQQQKRVHFERQKNEADDSGIASSDASCLATRQDDVTAPEVSPRTSNVTGGKQLKRNGEDGEKEEDDTGRDETTSDMADDRKNRRPYRTDKPGNKSCCMS